MIAVAASGRLWAEYIALFVGAPLLMAATFGMYPLFPVLLTLAGLACLLLHRTPGWRWRMLRRGPVLGEWRIMLGFALATAAVSLAVVLSLVPERLLEIPIHRPRLWLIIMVAYPLASALPQEIIYRSLFFERYGALFPDPRVAIAVNGAAFGLGHLFFGNWITIGMTAAGGAIMAWAYLRHRAIGLPWVLHSLAGQLIFTLGLGVYFYHGAVGAAP